MQKFALKSFDCFIVLPVQKICIREITETETEKKRKFRAENRKNCHVQNPAKIFAKRQLFAKEKREGKFRGNLSEGA